MDDRPCARSLPPNRSPHREQCPVRGWTLLATKTPEHVCQSKRRPLSALGPARQCSDAHSGSAKQHAELTPQRFDARLMIWQQRNEPTVHSQPGTLVHETHLLQARAPLLRLAVGALAASIGRRPGLLQASSGLSLLRSWRSSRVVRVSMPSAFGRGVPRAQQHGDIWPQWTRTGPSEPDFDGKKQRDGGRAAGRQGAAQHPVWLTACRGHAAPGQQPRRQHQQTR